MLKNKHHINIIYITHDLSTALQISDLVLIMYKGQVVERGDPESVILSPSILTRSSLWSQFQYLIPRSNGLVFRNRKKNFSRAPKFREDRNLPNHNFAG